jgi:uncharacterized membrane protein YesL
MATPTNMNDTKDGIIMDNGKEFGRGILSVITNHIYWLGLINFYFVLCNIVFLFFFISLIPSFSNMIVYFLALIPTGPALTALFYTLNKLMRDKEISPTKDFFYGYKMNFVETLKIWLPMLLVVFILVVDLQYLNSNPETKNQVFAGIILVVLLLIGTISVYVFSIAANFKFRVRDIYRLSVYYSFYKIKATTGNIGIVIVTLFLMNVTSDFILLLLASLICYTLVLNTHTVMEDIRLNFIKNDNKDE